MRFLEFCFATPIRSLITILLAGPFILMIMFAPAILATFICHLLGAILVGVLSAVAPLIVPVILLGLAWFFLKSMFKSLTGGKK